MLTTRIIPCLDVRDGRVVKGVRFRDLIDAGSPAKLASAYEAQGADEIALLDISATQERRKTRLDTLRAVREGLGVPLTAGGGVTSPDEAAALLDAGADKVTVNTAAVLRPSLVDALALRFGSQCAVVAVDAVRCGLSRWEVVVRGGTEPTGIDAVAWAKECASRGAGELLLTSFDRDGTRSGYDLELLGAVARAARIPVIASGGADRPEDLLDGLRAGAHAVLAASIFHFGVTTVGDVKRFLSEKGVRVRP